MSVLAGFARGMARGLAERSRQQMQFRQQVDLIGLQFAKEQKKEREKRERNRDAMVALGKQNGLTEASINNLVAAKNGGQTAEQIEKLVLRLQKQEKIDAARFEQQQKEHRAPIIERIANFDVNDQRMGASGKARLSRAPVQSPSGTAEYPSMVGEGEAVLQKTALARSQEKGQRDKDTLSAADQSSLLPSTIALYEKQNKIGTTGAELTRQDEIDEIRNRSSFVGPFDPDKLKGKYDESSRRIGFAGTAMSDDTIAAIEARNKDDYSQMLGSNSNLLLEVSKNNDSIKIVNSPFYNKNSDSLLSKISVNAVKTNDPKFNSSLNFVQNNLSLGDITQEDQLNILGKVLRPYNYKERLDSPDFAAGDEARKRAELEKSISIASSEDISDSKGKLEFVSEEEELARNKRISERMKTEVPEAGERAANQTMAMLSESQAPFREDFITDSELEELGFSNYEEYKDSFELELKTAAKQELLNNTGLKTQFVQEKIDEKYQQYFERQKMSAPLARAKTLLAITAGDSYGDAYDGTDESLNSLMKLMPKATVEAVKQAFSNSEFGLKPEAELTKSGALATDTRPLYVENTKTTEEILEDETVRAEVEQDSPEEFMGTSTYDLELARAQRKDLAKREAETGVMDAAGTAKKQFTFAAFDKNKPTTVNDLTVLAKEKPESIAASLVQNLSLPFADAGFTVLDPVVKSLSVFDSSEYISLDPKSLYALENSFSSQITLLKNAGYTNEEPELKQLMMDLAGVKALREGKLEYEEISGEQIVLPDINGMSSKEVAINLLAYSKLLTKQDLSPQKRKRLENHFELLSVRNDSFLEFAEANSTNPTEVLAGYAKQNSFIKRLNYLQEVKNRPGIADSTVQVLENNIHNELQYDNTAAGGYRARLAGYNESKDFLSLENDLTSLTNLKQQLEKNGKTADPMYKFSVDTLNLANNAYGRLVEKFPFKGKDLVTSIAVNTKEKDIVVGLKKQLKDLKVRESNLINNATGQVGEMAIAQNMPKLDAVQSQIKLVTKNINERETKIQKIDTENTARLLAVSKYELSKNPNSKDPLYKLLQTSVTTVNAATSKIISLKSLLEDSTIPSSKKEQIRKQIITEEAKRDAFRAELTNRLTEEAAIAKAVEDDEEITVFNNQGELVKSTGAKLREDKKKSSDQRTIYEIPAGYSEEAIQAYGRDTGVREKLSNKVSTVKSLDNLGQQLIGTATRNPTALTRYAGGLAGFTKTFVTELGALGKLLNGQSKEVSQEFKESRNFTRDEEGEKFLLYEDDVKQIANKMVADLPDSVSDLARARAKLRGDLVLFVFRVGAVEGQSGAAMSNRDFDRLMLKFTGTNDSEFFIREVNRYTTDAINKTNSSIDNYNNAVANIRPVMETMFFHPNIKDKVRNNLEFPKITQRTNLSQIQTIEQKSVPPELVGKVKPSYFIGKIKEIIELDKDGKNRLSERDKILDKFNASLEDKNLPKISMEQLNSYILEAQK